jgi:DNA-binding MarR family transcriptional regulator/GNAT superfamily N-acetyltransferase
MQTEHRIAALRRFNRFYTHRIGVLREGLSQSRFSLTEARVLYELANRSGPTATELATALDLDTAYLSRILRQFETEGLLTRSPSPIDRRQNILALTQTGHGAFAPLDAAAKREASALLDRMPPPEQEALLGSMARIESLLTETATPWTLRPPEPGDIGWVIARHGALYAAEYGFNEQFEALVAQVAGAYLAKSDPLTERCWIAEQNGVRLGSVFLMRKAEGIGRLRLLIVEPSARGFGIGKGLVLACIAFARQAGYRKLTLWTNDILLAARGIYRAAGFKLVASAPHSDFGPSMVGEDWELDLG